MPPKIRTTAPILLDPDNDSIKWSDVDTSTTLGGPLPAETHPIPDKIILVVGKPPKK